MEQRYGHFASLKCRVFPLCFFSQRSQKEIQHQNYQLFLLETAQAGTSYAVVPECLAFYRIHPDNTRTNDWFLKEQEKFYHRLSAIGIFVTYRPYKFLYHYGLCINLLRQRSRGAFKHFLRLFGRRFYLLRFLCRFVREKAVLSKQRKRALPTGKNTGKIL